MPDKSAPDNLGDIIGAVLGFPITLFILVIWSPFLLLAAIFNVFSSEVPKPAAHAAVRDNAGAATKEPEQPFSKGGFLIAAAGLFAIFVFLLNFKSGGGSGVASHGSGGYSSPAYSAPGGPVGVNEYFRRDGTYVPGHYRSAPNGDPSNNWSNSPNVNPYTGKPGTHHPKNGR
jgi:hypothetical protein